MLAVRRELGPIIGRGILPGKALPRRGTAAYRHAADIVVRGPRFVLLGHGGEDEMCAIRAEGEIVAAAECVRRRIGVAIPGRHVVRFAPGGRQHKQVLPLILHPFIPVPEEQPVEDPCLDWILGLLVDPFLVERVALGIRLAGILRPDRGHERNRLAVARPDCVACLRGDRRQLPCLAAGHIDDPELVLARAIRFKQDLFAVRAPARMTVVLGAAGQLPRLSFRGRGKPDIGRRLVAR